MKVTITVVVIKLMKVISKMREFYTYADLENTLYVPRNEICSIPQDYSFQQGTRKL